MSPEEEEKVVMRMLGPATIYEKLEVSPSASLGQVKKAYRKLTLKIHPDKNNHPRADEAFKLISSEVEMLMDINRRLKYDHQLLQKSSPFLIFVKAGKSLTSFLVSSLDTISVVKDKLSKHWVWLDRYDKEEMMLGRPGWHLAGIKMKDDRRLLDYEVKQNQVLYMVLESFGEQELKKELEEEKDKSIRLEKQMVDQKEEVEQQMFDIKNEVQVERDRSDQLQKQVLEHNKLVEVERKRSNNLERENIDFKKKIEEDRVTIKRLQQQNGMVEHKLSESKVKLNNAEELLQKLNEEQAMKKKLNPAYKRKEQDNVEVRVKIARLDKIRPHEEDDAQTRSTKNDKSVKQSSITNKRKNIKGTKMVIRKIDSLKGKTWYVSRLVCSEVGCPKKSNSTFSIRKQARSVHDGEKTFKCNCGDYFNRREALDDHQRKMHNLPKLVCKVAGCMVKFRSARTLRHHRKKHEMEL